MTPQETDFIKVYAKHLAWQRAYQGRIEKHKRHQARQLKLHLCAVALGIAGLLTSILLYSTT